jgi:hypothetical protein
MHRTDVQVYDQSADLSLAKMCESREVLRNSL